MAEETFEMAPYFEVRIDEVRDYRTHVLLVGRQRGTVGGVPIDEVLVELYEFEAGQVMRVQDFTSVEEASKPPGCRSSASDGKRNFQAAHRGSEPGAARYPASSCSPLIPPRGPASGFPGSAAVTRSAR
jgi:hypothetical protein